MWLTGLCFFPERVINVWNSLPRDVTNFSSVKAFKHSLRAIDLSGFCMALFSMFVCSFFPYSVFYILGQC